MMSDDVPAPRLIRTLLSKRPRSGSVYAALAASLMLVLVSMIAWTDFGGLASLLPATHAATLDRLELWRLFTTIGVHGDLKHLMSNFGFFFVLAFMLHAYFGAAIFPGLVFALGGAVSYLTMLAHPSHVTSVGASGVVYLMMGFWLTSYFFIERRLSTGKRLLVATGFALSLLVPAEFDPQVDHIAHGIGFVVGLAAGALHFAVRRRELRAAEEWWMPPPPAPEPAPDPYTEELTALALRTGELRKDGSSEHLDRSRYG